MARITKTRWATHNGEPVKEVTLYAKVGEEGVSADHPLKFKLAGETGEWIALKIDVCFSAQPVTVGVDPATEPLATGVVIITEAAYDALIAA